MARGAGSGIDPDPDAVAKEICLRLLTDRARTRLELSQALRRRGVPDEVSARVLDRFGEVGLIDDQAFAGQWVRSRHRRRGLGRQALAVELCRKGIAKETADEALAEVDSESERLRATEMVVRRLRTMPVQGSDDRVKAGRRLLGMLARKGYPAGLAHQVVRAALVEHGAEEDELGPADLG
jgi:regulatory protein